MSLIVSLFKHASKGEFEALLDPHVERLYRTAFRFAGDRSDAEELVQDLLVHLYQRRGQLAQIEDLGTWLTKVLYNRFIDGLRRKERDPFHGAEDIHTIDDLPCADHVGTSEPEAAAESEQFQLRLASALTRVNANQRALIALHDMEGYTLPELASLLETSIGTLKSRLHRARQRLREELDMEPSSDATRVKDKEA